MLRLALALVVGVAAWAAAPLPASADDRFLSEEGRCRVAFPRPPQEDAKAGDDGRYHRFRAEVDGVTYSVDWTDLAAEEIRKAGEPEILLHRLRDALARDKTVLAEKPLSIGGSPGDREDPARLRGAGVFRHPGDKRWSGAIFLACGSARSLG